MLELLNYQSHQVRVVIRDGEPWFVAKDVCDVLEITNSRDAVSRLDPDERGVVSTDTPGGVQEVQAVNESGLYVLILGSRKQEAKDFKRWITHEVLPSIRKTGSYSAQPQYQLPSNYLEALEAHLQSERARIAAEKQLELQAPKVALYDVAMQANNAQPVGTVAKTLNVGPNKLFAFLREHKILISQGAKYNLPYQEYIDRGYFEVRQYTITHFTQGIENKSQTLVTPKGLAYIHKLLEQSKQPVGV